MSFAGHRRGRFAFASGAWIADVGISFPLTPALSPSKNSGARGTELRCAVAMAVVTSGAALTWMKTELVLLLDLTLALSSEERGKRVDIAGGWGGVGLGGCSNHGWTRMKTMSVLLLDLTLALSSEEREKRAAIAGGWRGVGLGGCSGHGRT